MTINSRVLGSVAASVLAVVLALNFLSNSPEKEIGRLFNEIEELASYDFKAAKPHPFVRLQQTRRLADKFTDTLIAEFEIPGKKVRKISDQEQLVKYITLGMSRFDELKVRFYDINIALSQSQTEAVVNLTAVVKGRLKQDPDALDSAQELRFDLVEDNSQWLIKSAKTIDLLEN